MRGWTFLIEKAAREQCRGPKMEKISVSGVEKVPVGMEWQCKTEWKLILENVKLLCKCRALCKYKYLKILDFQMNC